MRRGALSRPFQPLRRIAALCAAFTACMGLVSCASPPPVPPSAAPYQPAMRSALVGRADLHFLVARDMADGAGTTVLARQQPRAAPRPVARLLQARHGMDTFISVQLLPEHWATRDRIGLERATLEQLYSLVLRQDPMAHYCVAADDTSNTGTAHLPCEAAPERLSHAQLLQLLAGLRERATWHAPDAVPWRVVELQRGPAQPGDADTVGVRATSQLWPLPDIAIHFDRAPHSLCTARTRADGVASCRLEDQHADGHQHDHATAVVATFPGDVRPDRVLLPTTRVLQGPASAARPAFARPIPFPAARP